MAKKPIFYGLLHINEFDFNLNFKFKNQFNKINTYFLNSLLLAKSLNEKNLKFILLTNNKITLEKMNTYDFKVNIEEISFNTEIIKQGHFSSCHYRLDIFNYLSNKDGYSVLVDLDVVAINNLQKNIYNLIESDNVAFVNDITNNVIPAYGLEKIQRNLDLVLGEKSQLRWYGGDIFFGDSSFFKQLYNTVIFTYNNYKKNFNILKDQTDELFISAGIELLKKNTKIKILNTREYGVLDRFWSVNTKHKQEKFDDIKNNFLLHFPADKIFLSRFALKHYTSNFFLASYDRYKKSPIKIIKNYLSKLYHLS